MQRNVRTYMCCAAMYFAILNERLTGDCRYGNGRRTGTTRMMLSNPSKSSGLVV
jgi:hypothetical protein